MNTLEGIGPLTDEVRYGQDAIYVNKGTRLRGVQDSDNWRAAVSVRLEKCLEQFGQYWHMTRRMFRELFT